MSTQTQASCITWYYSHPSVYGLSFSLKNCLYNRKSKNENYYPSFPML